MAGMSEVNGGVFWENRYKKGETEWDMGRVSPPIKRYIDSQLNDARKDLAILIAGAGNAYEAQYLHELGFTHVVVVDFAKAPLENFARQNPTFNKEHLLQSDFFELDEQKYQFDLSLEQTFFCAIDPKRRAEFVQKTHHLLKPSGKLAGVLWDCDFAGLEPPYGGNKSEYQTLFSPRFEFAVFADCMNSHPKRQGRELFIELIAK